jgi:hypothetical protein
MVPGVVPVPVPVIAVPIAAIVVIVIAMLEAGIIVCTFPCQLTRAMVMNTVCDIVVAWT